MVTRITGFAFALCFWLACGAAILAGTQASANDGSGSKPDYCQFQNK